MDLDPSLAIITGLTVTLAQKVFGSTFDLISEEVRGVTQQGIERLKRVFENANKKSLNTSDPEAAVPMRLAAKVIQESRFCADELMVEYFGGVPRFVSHKNISRRSYGLSRCADQPTFLLPAENSLYSLPNHKTPF
jgi:hypothetical protein